MTDTSGNVLTTQHYFPCGGVRSGSVGQTDKLFTGQQQELGDAALGLYNYKASRRGWCDWICLGRSRRARFGQCRRGSFFRRRDGRPSNIRTWRATRD